MIHKPPPIGFTLGAGWWEVRDWSGRYSGLFADLVRLERWILCRLDRRPVLVTVRWGYHRDTIARCLRDGRDMSPLTDRWIFKVRECDGRILRTAIMDGRPVDLPLEILPEWLAGPLRRQAARRSAADHE